MRKLSLPIRILLAFLSFVLGVALFASVVVTALIADIQIVTSQDTIQTLVLELISSPAHIRVTAPIRVGEGSSLRVQAPVRNHQALRLGDAEAVAGDLTQQLIDMFYDQIVEQFGDQLPETFPDKQEFTQMVQDSTVKDYMAEKTAGLITDYFNDTVTTTFTADEVVQLIEENADLIVSITGEAIPEDIAQQVGQIFDNNEIIQKVEAEGLAGFMEDENLQIPGLEAIVGGENSVSIRDVLNTVRDFASRQNLIYGIIICVVLIAAILLINAAQLQKGLRRAGYPLIWAGLPVVVNLLALYYPEMWTGVQGLTVAQKLFQQTAIVNIVVFGTGFLLVLAGIILAIALHIHAKHLEQQELRASNSDMPVDVAAQVFDVTNVPILTNPVETPVAAQVEEDDILARAAVFADEPAEEAPVEEAAIEEQADVFTLPEEEPIAEESAEEEPAAETPTEETV